MSPKKKPGMLKRGVQPKTINNVAAKVQAAESATTQQYETKNVALSNINLWEDQPRAFKLTTDDVIRGFILEDDEHYGDKSDELNNIISLALSIKELGLLYTPLAFALPGKCVQLLGGQRRTMASIFALFHIISNANDDGDLTHEVKVSPAPDLTLLDNERIAIKVFSRKPDDITLERMAVADNTQRSDLSIGDRLRWAVKFANMLHDLKHELTWRDLADTLALNRSQAFEWKKVIDNRDDQYIKKTIDLVIQELISFKQLTELAAESVKNRKAMFDSWFKKKTKSDSIKKVSLGSTSNYSALKSLIMANVHGAQTEVFEKVDWEKPQQVKKAFNAFLTYWETNHG
ncbi:MAG: hypothetical protein QM500_05710 [Methylococcales bacterium]